MIADPAHRSRDAGAVTALWVSALGGRLAYVVHRACGHAVTWRTSPPDLPLCPGDIACGDCRQVLWCRAHDPWRARSSGGGDAPADHWGQTREEPTSLFEGLEQVLRLAGQCPAGPVGDDIRRAACELVEAESRAARHAGRRRMLKAIAGIEWRHARGRIRGDDPTRSTARQLAAVLRHELRTD